MDCNKTTQLVTKSYLNELYFVLIWSNNEVSNSIGRSCGRIAMKCASFHPCDPLEMVEAICDANRV